MPDGEGRKKRTAETFDSIMTETLPTAVINYRCRKRRTPSRISTKKIGSYSVFKLQKIKNETKQILKDARAKNSNVQSGKGRSHIRRHARRERAEIPGELKEKPSRIVSSEIILQG